MIDQNTTLEALAAIVCQALRNAEIDSFLSGGAVVSIYSKNQYESYDLDFVSFGDRRRIGEVMESLGFIRDKSRLFRHPDTVYMVEFPGTAIMIGDNPIHEFAERNVNGKTLKLLTPTDCIRDRLAAYIHWNDRQGLQQAVIVASAEGFHADRVRKFCVAEGSPQAFEDFKKLLTAEGSKKA
jgi:hypothetical protein